MAIFRKKEIKRHIGKFVYKRPCIIDEHSSIFILPGWKYNIYNSI